jgi:hypothetical protein
MAEENKRKKIFPGKGIKPPVIQDDPAAEATSAVTKNRGTVYKAKSDRYKGKHEKK